MNYKALLTNSYWDDVNIESWRQTVKVSPAVNFSESL